MSGKLGKADLAAAADTDLYTTPAGIVATASVAFVNRTAAAITVRLAVRSAALANSDYLEYDASIPANGVLERTGIVLSPGEIITVRASAVGVSARAHGFEETA
jgi:hypothetical protein